MELINSNELLDYQNKSLYPYFDYNIDDESINLIYVDNNLVLMMDFIDMSFRPPVRSLNRFINELEKYKHYCSHSGSRSAKLSILIPTFEINVNKDNINIKCKKK